MIRTFAFAISLMVAGLAAGPAVAEKLGNFEIQVLANESVASTVINRQGYKLTLDDGTEVTISKVVSTKRRCMVHIPSLKLAVEAGLRNGSLKPFDTTTAAQQINLQVLQDPNTGEVWCAGAGSGCAITVE